jgi:CDP-2,3-bis-(O-geranylgeranyl)-sn-glycerol synthase
VPKDILFALWFFLPAALANGVPVLVAQIPWLKKFEAPMDLGKTYRGKRIFGAHKTWRGFIAAVLTSTLVLWWQQLAAQHFGWAQWLTSGEVDYATLPTLLMGPIFGASALIGDAVESFLKRQRGTPPGHGWFPWDQLDYIIAAAIATSPFVPLSLWQYVWVFGFWFTIHIVSSYLGYLGGIKDRPI